MGSFTVASKTEVEDSGTEAVFVFVNGLFGGGISKQTRKYLRERFPRCRFISLHCGAVSSVRDRAVECFWQLRGGTTDYQVDGELEYGHGRYGETYLGLLKEWSDERPIHIIAYSLGASTARCLQHLLERRAFCDAHDQIPTSGAWYAYVHSMRSSTDTVGIVFVTLNFFSPFYFCAAPLCEIS